MPKVYGSRLATQWGVSVAHALYRETGDWYHQLEKFPGALLDADGYVIFESKEAFESCPYLRIGQDVNVRQGIKEIPGYVQVVVNGQVQARHLIQRTTYEATVRIREGAAYDVVQTRYERDREARAACIAHYGSACTVCGMNFVARYGKIGEDYIHVHHLDPLAIGGERLVDPIKDLRPVCPNCHAMLHRKSPPLSIAELKEMLAPLARRKEGRSS